MNLLSRLLKRLATMNRSQHIRRLKSSSCSQAQLQSEAFQTRAAQLHISPVPMHRKVWEFCFIAQALHERGVLTPGRRGLGFAVGQEPLVALFASSGCQIIATDLETEEAQKSGWVKSAEHADSLESLNRQGICDPELFRQRVSFRFLDMRRLPDDLVPQLDEVVG